MKFRHIDELHKFFAGGAVGAFLAGIGTAIKANQIDFQCVYLAVICMFMRFKFWIDDREYFLRVEKGKFPNEIGFQTGVVIGIISWMPWIVAGLLVGTEAICSGIMVSVFILSAMWILSTKLDRPLNKLQVRWLYINVIYTVLFFALSTGRAHWFPLPEHRQAFAFCIETLLAIIVATDAYLSGTLIAVSKFTDVNSN